MELMRIPAYIVVAVLVGLALWYALGNPLYY